MNALEWARVGAAGTSLAHVEAFMQSIDLSYWHEVAILAGRGYEVWALTGKAEEHGWLASLGTVGFLAREEAPVEGPPLERERWSAVVDAVGAATLPYALELAAKGAVAAARENPALARGVNIWRGRTVHAAVAEAVGETPTPLEACLR